VAYRLDIVAVEIEHEGTVVVLVIMRTQARLAVVLAAGGDGRPVEGVDRGARGRRKGHMDVPDTQAFGPADPEERLEIRTKADCGAMTCLFGRDSMTIEIPSGSSALR
jgi:hypothetical protein